ncbi:Lipoyl synthase [subsurface metagenome]
MVGLGESWEELEAVMVDLVDAGVEQLVVGQYLKPRQGSYDVVEYLPPEYFLRIEETARSIGIAHVYARPLARTSYALALKKPD